MSQTMAGDSSEDTTINSVDNLVSQLLECSEKLNTENPKKEVSCYSWSEVSPWNLVAPNVTYLTSFPRSCAKKKKVKTDGAKKGNNIQLQAGETLILKSRKNIARRNYGTLSYDTPTWRFVVDPQTYEYVARNDPNRILAQHRETSRSANYKKEKGARECTRLDPATFFDEQLCIAFTDKENFFSARLNPFVNRMQLLEYNSTSINCECAKEKRVHMGDQLVGEHFLYGRSILKEAEGQSKNLGRDKVVVDTLLTGRNSQDHSQKQTLRERLSSISVTFKREQFNLKTSAMELNPQPSARDVHNRSQLILNRVKLMQDSAHKKVSNRTIEHKDKIDQKLSKQFKENVKGISGTLRYSDLGLPLLPKFLTSEEDCRYPFAGQYESPITKPIRVIDRERENENVPEEIHLPSICQVAYSNSCTKVNVSQNDQSNRLLPPILGTKMELSITNSNQSLL